MARLKNLRQTSKDFRVMCFSIFNAVIAFVLTLVIHPQFAPYSPILVPFLNRLTKYINNRYFGDIGMPTLPQTQPTDGGTA